jgi:hypothetical protein
MCFSFKVGATPHKAAMRSMELMMSEASPDFSYRLEGLKRKPRYARLGCGDATAQPLRVLADTVVMLRSAVSSMICWRCLFRQRAAAFVSAA